MSSDEFLDSLLSAGIEAEKKEEAFGSLRRENLIKAIINACDDVLASPESTPFIKRCAIDTAYKRIVRIVKGDKTNG